MSDDISNNPTSKRADQNKSTTPTESVSDNPIENLIVNTAEKPAVNMSEQTVEGEQDAGFEETRYDDHDYTPEFIEAKCENPPLLPGESKDRFLEVFDAYQFFHNGRAKTVAEYMMVWHATTITWELMRYERMKIKIQMYHQRSAVETVYRKTYGDLATESDPKEFKASARKWTQHYFANAEYRQDYAARLEAAGYGIGAIDVETFQRSFNSLSQLERLIANLEKRLLSILKRLDDIYAARHPQMKMNRAYQPLLPEG